MSHLILDGIFVLIIIIGIVFGIKRGAVKIVYYDTGNQDLNGNVCFIPNRTKLLCAINGATYTVLFGADTA